MHSLFAGDVWTGFSLKSVYVVKKRMVKKRDKTKKQLTTELGKLQQRVAELETPEDERKRAVKVLKASETRYRRLFESAQDGILILEADTGKIIDANPFMVDMLGYAREEFLGKQLWEIGLFEDIAENKIAFESLQKEKYIRYEHLPLRAKDGKHRDVEFVSNVYLANSNKVIQCNIRDITEHKRAVEEIERLASFPKLNPMPIVEVDQKGQLTYTNPAAQQRFPDLDKRQYKHPFLSGLKPYPSRLQKTKRKYLFREVEVGNDWYSQIISFADPEHIRIYASDITERKRMEETLRDSEQKYRELINGMNDTAWVIGFDGNFIDVNDAAVEVLGYSREELLAMGPHDIDSSLDDKKITGLIKRIRKDKLQVFETTHTTKGGKTIPVEIKSSLVTYQGKDAILSIARDITDRKQAEEALRASEERFRSVVETMKVGMGAIDENSVLTYVNEHFAKMLGYSIDEMIGRSTLDFYDEESHKIQEEIFKKRRAGMRDPTQYEVTWRRKDGQKVYAILSPTPVFDADGHYTASFAIHTDITERKRIEEALRESEEEFRTFMETASDLMHITDKDFNYTYVNDAMARILGYSKEEMMGMNIANVVKEETVKNDFKRNVEALKKYGEISFETVRVAKDGKGIPGELKLVAIFDKDGAFAGTRGVFRDITERKRAEVLIQIRMRLMEFAATHSLRELLQRTVDEVCEFTDSSVGFYHFVEADQKTLSLQAWSTRTVAEFCTADAEGMHYSIDEAGVWVDCIRERRPVVHNDYASLPHRKGIPEGHTPIIRELVVPIMRNDRFVAILGIGNKPQDYTDQDIQVVSYLADVAWEIAERKQAEEALKESEEHFRNLAERSPNMIYINVKGKIVYANEKCSELTGYTREEFYAPDFDFMTLMAPESRDLIKEQYSKHMQGEEVAPYEYVLITKNGREVDAINATRLIQYGGERALLGVVTDITERKKAEEDLQHSYQQMQEMMVTTVNALASTVEMKDQYTAGHQPRVTQLACAIAEEMDLAEEQIDGIRMAGLIHDIGKIMVPAEILNKPGPLTEIQYDMVKMYPQASYEILKDIQFPWPVAKIVLQHQELMDGSGYPQGLSGEEILLESRILTVANVVEAMVSHRPYRAAHSIETALEEISSNKGKLYDPTAVDACLKLFAERRFTFD